MGGFNDPLKGVQNVDVTANNELTLEGNLIYLAYRVDIKPVPIGESICPPNGCHFRNLACKGSKPKETLCRYENEYLGYVITTVSYNNGNGWYPGNL